MRLSDLRKDWKFRLTSAIAGTMCAALPGGTVTLVSQELIALFGLLLAGALPTMILTATILRAGAFSPKRVGDYATALDKQLSFWFSLFIWALVACVAIMLSKALWNGGRDCHLIIPAVAVGQFRWTVIHIALTPAANFILGFAGAQVAGRLLPMLAGLRSLLRLNSKIAQEEAEDKVHQDLKPGRQKVAELKPTEGHGELVE